MKTNINKKARETVICGVASTKSGGKSTIQGCLFDWMHFNNPNIKCIGWDIGSESSTLKRLAPSLQVECLQRKKNCLDEVINSASTGDWDVVLYDVPADFDTEITRVFEIVDPSLLQMLNIRYVCSVVITPCPDSISTAKQVLKNAPSWIQYIAVFNFFSGLHDYPQDFLDLVDQKTISRIEIPKYSISGEQKHYDRLGLSWGMALSICENYFDSDRSFLSEFEGIMSVSTSMRLSNHIEQIHREFETLKHIFLPSQFHRISNSGVHNEKEVLCADITRELFERLDPEFKDILLQYYLMGTISKQGSVAHFLRQMITDK